MASLNVSFQGENCYQNFNFSNEIRSTFVLLEEKTSVGEACASRDQGARLWTPLKSPVHQGNMIPREKFVGEMR